MHGLDDDVADCERCVRSTDVERPRVSGGGWSGDADYKSDTEHGTEAAHQ